MEVLDARYGGNAEVLVILWSLYKNSFLNYIILQ